MLNKLISTLCAIAFFVMSASSQDVSVKGSNGRSDYMRTRSDGDCSNNYSSKGNTNPYTGKAGTIPCGPENTIQTGGPGTGEFFLVPAIVRTDPKGTAFRFNTCGTALITLLDKGSIYDLTDRNKQYFTPEVALSVAESRFRMATQYDSKNYVYFANLASVLYRQRRFDEALEAILKALELKPDDVFLLAHEQKIRNEKVTVKISDETEELR